MTFENLMLLVIVVQGFAVWWFEWQVYKIHKDRYNERAKWREQKRKQQERKIITPSEATSGTVQSDRGDVAKSTHSTEGVVRDMQKVDEKA